MDVFVAQDFFSRTDLRPHRQMIYDQQGNVVTDAKYDRYANYDGIEFPSVIEIERPQEDYDIVLNMVKLELNKPLKDGQFALEQPPGAEVVRLGQTTSDSAKGTMPREVLLVSHDESNDRRQPGPPAHSLRDHDRGRGPGSNADLVDRWSVSRDAPGLAQPNRWDRRYVIVLPPGLLHPA